METPVGNGEFRIKLEPCPLVPLQKWEGWRSRSAASWMRIETQQCVDTQLKRRGARKEKAPIL
jgi:hypothetical protein